MITLKYIIDYVKFIQITKINNTNCAMARTKHYWAKTSWVTDINW